MIEILALLGIMFAFAHQRGEPWGKTTDRLRAWAVAAAGRLQAWLEGARDRAPGLVDQCLIDLDGLRDDVLGALGPSLRRPVESRWPKLAGRRVTGAAVVARAGGAETDETAAPAAATKGAAGLAEGAARLRASGAEALGRLQQRYVEGAISLDQYTREVARLRTRPS